MKREKIIKELEGQKKHIDQAMADTPIDRTKEEFFTNEDRILGYWYGRRVGIEEALRLLTAGREETSQ